MQGNFYILFFLFILKQEFSFICFLCHKFKFANYNLSILPRLFKIFKLSHFKSLPALEECSVQLYHQTAGVTEMQQLSEQVNFHQSPAGELVTRQPLVYAQLIMVVLKQKADFTAEKGLIFSN